MATPHLLRACALNPVVPSEQVGISRPNAGRLAHLLGMASRTSRDTDPERIPLQLIEQVLSLTQLCEHLHVTPQTIYDLRSQGRGPRGFRVGRELRFRVSEIDAWLARMESDDGRRHSIGGR